MKRWSLTVVFLVLVAFCDHKTLAEEISMVDPILRGEHTLRQISEQDVGGLKIKIKYLFMEGNFTRSSQSFTRVKFVWEMTTNEYVFSSLPIEKIRIKLDNNVEIPTIKFRWRPYNFRGTPDIQGILDYSVIYAVVTLRSEWWPTLMEAPLEVR